MLTCKTLLLTVCLAGGAFAANPRVELLWPDGAPGAVGTEDVDKPSLAIYLPQGKPTAASGVIVCPGGGYGGLAMDHEGSQIALWLNAHGVAAFVLKYRLGPRYHHPAPLQDAQRAIRYVRENAASLGIAPDRIGIWGFSAGGHLASTTGTHFDAGTRPDFLILCYPVISFTTPYTHQGSLKNLLGENPDPKLVENLSNELQVTAQTPPAFLFYTNEDPVRPENAVLFYMAMRKAGVPAELHIYEHGLHGVGLALMDPILSSWPPRLADWMKLHGWMN
jgi:acetyl esterase/lipase